MEAGLFFFVPPIFNSARSESARSESKPKFQLELGLFRCSQYIGSELRQGRTVPAGRSAGCAIGDSSATVTLTVFQVAANAA
jgi:hypothetical protein